jgi:hypothetical protein
MTSAHLRLVHSSDAADTIELPDDFPVGELPPNAREELDNIWREPERIFQAACVCSLLAFEERMGRPIATPEQISEAIKFIDQARYGYDGKHFWATPFASPSFLALRLWRLRHETTEIVLDSCTSTVGLFDCQDDDSLLDMMGESPIWKRARDEVQRALARSIRFLDPSIDRWTSDTQIAPIVEVVLKLRRYEPCVSYPLNEMDALLSSDI